MDSEVVLKLMSYLNAWLLDIWRLRGTPYIQTALVGPHATYAKAGGMDFDLISRSSNPVSITFNISVDAIENEGIKFKRVPASEGHMVMTFTCRFNGRYVDVFVPLPSFEKAYDKFGNAAEAIVIWKYFRSGRTPDILASFKAEHTEAMKVINGKATVSDQSKPQILKYTAATAKDLYIAAAHLGFVCALSKLPFQLYVKEDDSAWSYMTDGKNGQARYVYETEGGLTMELSDIKEPHKVLIYPSSADISFKGQEGVYDSNPKSGTLISFNYGKDLDQVTVSNHVRYISDHDLVKTILETIGTKFWPTLSLVNVEMYEASLAKERAISEELKLCQKHYEGLTTGKKEAKVLNMADFRNKPK